MQRDIASLLGKLATGGLPEDLRDKKALGAKNIFEIKRTGLAEGIQLLLLPKEYM